MMRITTRMLDETAKRTGIPINRTSILSYMGNTQGGNTLLDALNKNQKVPSASAEGYKQMEKTADKLADAADKLRAKGEDSLYEKARASEDYTELHNGVKDFVENYNATLSSLAKSGSPLDVYYSGMLKEAADENSGTLEKIGITVGRDGKLTVDSEKLKKASADDIENAFGSSSSLTSKASFIAGKASDNAQANAESASSQYNRFGNAYSQITSKYDFWG